MTDRRRFLIAASAVVIGSVIACGEAELVPIRLTPDASLGTDSGSDGPSAGAGGGGGSSGDGTGGSAGAGSGGTASGGAAGVDGAAGLGGSAGSGGAAGIGGVDGSAGLGATGGVDGGAGTSGAGAAGFDGGGADGAPPTHSVTTQAGGVISHALLPTFTLANTTEVERHTAIASGIEECRLVFRVSGAASVAGCPTCDFGFSAALDQAVIALGDCTPFGYTTGSTSTRSPVTYGYRETSVAFSLSSGELWRLTSGVWSPVGTMSLNGDWDFGADVQWHIDWTE